MTSSALLTQSVLITATRFDLTFLVYNFCPNLLPNQFGHLFFKPYIMEDLNCNFALKAACTHNL